MRQSIIYTVDLTQVEFPVRYFLPDDNRPHWFPGPFADPGEASQAFQATYQSEYDCHFTDADVFEKLLLLFPVAIESEQLHGTTE